MTTMTPANYSPKQTLRSQLLDRRQALPALVWQAHSELICDRLSANTAFRDAHTVLAYQSCRQEPSLNYLFTHHHKQWGLPRCLDRDLQWHRWKPLQTLVSGSYGILEPPPTSPLLSPQEIDLILVPAIAVDRDGYRLGYGGGYYDRLRADPLWRKIPTIGIIFDFAYVDRLPIDPWDVPVDAVCTELGFRD
ncbi:5-formyltetrahydrofolate cyclo-ligase [Chamaesiphon sp. OTE_8_metabat_110]|uniref:5-formyltetrahydrofolate cyclo-ligase n=1 Tax=Chamaesiphon sp. OTE_8_metabat_110 TaxID=2964696 RepID=UPI00286CC0EB|nr:5-formyltetrahydrofolate cyclo-ligase [Chamaesiphon sp. OTE_8_metabat_110]